MKSRYLVLAMIAVLFSAACGTALYGDTRHVDNVNLFNRQLTVANIGDTVTPVRVLVKTWAPGGYTTVSSGSDLVLDGDEHATRINTKPLAEASDYDHNGMSARFRGTPLTQFNAPNQTANIMTKFYWLGHYSSFSDPLRYDLSRDVVQSGRMFVNGETPSVGATLNPIIMHYNVDVIERRKLKLTTGALNLGNVLRGANILSSSFVVNTTNSRPNWVTNVTVAKGGQAMGQLTANETLVNASGKKNIALTGRLTEYNAALSKSAQLTVETAEAATAGDTKAYSKLNVSYKANVGVAKIAKTATFTGAPVLSAQIGAGEQLASYKGATFNSSDPAQTWSLSSRVAQAGTLATNTTTAESITGPGSLGAALYGAVGSEAEIVASTPVNKTTTSTLTMQWRKRTAGEALHPGPLVVAPGTTGPIPKWLTSDVVKIGGTALDAGDVTYALQMTFDNRINLALDGQTNGTPEKEFEDLYIAKLNTGNQWERAAAGTGHWQSLAAFLEENNTKTLDQLEGNWGVDPTPVDGDTDKQRYKSWAIIRNTGGTFAVVPEPATVIMMISACMGAMAYGWRRLRSPARQRVWQA
jgi:hypothetical protein